MENIDYSTPYISPNEYLVAKGVNLEIELQDDDNKTVKVERFIKDLTDFVMNELVKQYGDNDLNPNVKNFADLKLFRRMRFHRGMIEQIEYVLNNGLIHQDSGINKQMGVIIDFSNVIISKSAFNEFYLGAFCNIKRC